MNSYQPYWKRTTLVVRLYLCTVLLLVGCTPLLSQQRIDFKKRRTNAMTGMEFIQSISDSCMDLKQREKRIFKEVKQGNVPDFLRKTVMVTDTLTLHDSLYTVEYWVMPDYLAIGSNNNFVYLPMTPMLAQKIASLFHCSLPTSKMVDRIYQSASIKLEPQPIPPSNAMTTVPVFLQHSNSILAQLKVHCTAHQAGALTAGHKKDIILSPKIYGEPTPRVVIYGWHLSDHKVIQPVYNKHTNTWVDYSHGVRLVANTVYINGKRTSVQKVVADPVLCGLLSKEGVMMKAYYPQ